MASAIMHLCIAKKINEKLKRDTNMLYLGAIAPDLSKQIGMDRSRSHFGNKPDLGLFTSKYKDYKENDFELGYYIHLLSDIIWQEEYLDKVIYMSNVEFLSGVETKVSDEDISYLVYNDYTNLNSELIDYYGLPLDLFFGDITLPDTKITEIEISKLQIIVDKMGVVLTESKTPKNYIFDIKNAIEYIDVATHRILKRLEFKEVDLHMHTTHSDGTETVLNVLKTCEKEKLDYISITDHDTVLQYKEVRKYRKYFSGKIIPGCEITTTYNGSSIEILAYGFDINKMNRELKKNLIPFKKRGKLAGKKINDTYSKLGMKYNKKLATVFVRDLFNDIITYEENDVFFNNIECKNDFKNFFREEYSNPASKFFVNLSSIHPTMDKVIEMIHNAGGYAFIAHAYEYDSNVTQSLMKDVLNYKIDGMECFHTSHTKEESLELVKFCRNNNLFISGGSDFHGTAKIGHEIGSVNIDLKYINFIENIKEII